MIKKKRIVVICPGRGSYTKDSLGYLQKDLKDLKPRADFKDFEEILKDYDNMRLKMNEPTLSELDSMKEFKVSVHTKGEHASAIIYTSALKDYLSIDQNKYEVCAIIGNSMGWYLSLALSHVLSHTDSFHLIQTMGSMMKGGLIGGQIIYPVVDEAWRPSNEKENLVRQALNEINDSGEGEVYLSIWLGGYRVLAGDANGIKALLKRLPREGDFPFQLINHGAFHTPLLLDTSEKAFELIQDKGFKKPEVPIIDGRGRIFTPWASDPKEIYNYTLGHQVYAPYDFTQSLKLALKEFAPDHLVLLGPGTSLGGAIGQTLIEVGWRGLGSKDDFQELQKAEPFLLAMDMKEQRALLV